MDAANHVVAFDLGGTRLRMAVVDRQGKILAVRREATRATEGPERGAQRIIAAIQGVLSQHPAYPMAAIGAAVASPVDPQTGIMHTPPNLPGWDGHTLKPVLEETFRVPVYVANDATLAALGEHRFGAGRGLAHLVYITVSTGIGGGIIAHGQLLTGAQGMAGEIGHMVVDTHGPPCACGNNGCLESLASGTAMARRALERLAAGGGGLLETLAARGGPEDITAERVTQAARQGDALAREVLREVAADLAAGIVSLIHIFDPEVVLLGGGVSQGYDLLQPTLSQVIDQRVMAHYKGRELVRPSALGDEAGLLGAAALAFDQLQRPSGRQPRPPGLEAQR